MDRAHGCERVRSGRGARWRLVVEESLLCVTRIPCTKDRTQALGKPHPAGRIGDDRSMLKPLLQPAALLHHCLSRPRLELTRRLLRKREHDSHRREGFLGRLELGRLEVVQKL